MPFIAVLVLLNYWNMSSMNYYQETVENDVTEGRVLFEQRIEALKSAAYSFSLSDEMRWIISCADIQKSTSEENYITNLIRCGDRLNEVFADGDLFSDYCMVTQNDYAFRRQSMSVGKEFFFNNYRDYDNMSYEEWYDVSFKEKSWNIIPLHKININGIEETALTFNYPIRYTYGKNEDAGAVIQFFLKSDDVADMFSPIMDMFGEVYIFDKDSNLLACISEHGASYDEYVEELMDKDNSGFYEIDGNKKLLVSQKSENNEFTVIAILPPEIVLMHPQLIRRMAIIVLMVILLLEIILGYLFARQFTSPLKKVICNMQNIYDDISSIKTKKKKSLIAESEILEEGVNSLLTNNIQMKSELKNKDEKYKFNFFTLLYNGGFRTNKQVDDEAANANVIFSDGMHYVITIFSEQADKVKLKIENTIKTSALISMYKVEDKVLVVLLSYEEDGYEVCQDILKVCANDCDLKVFAGQGRMYVDKSNLCNSYRQAYYSMEYAIRVNNSGNIIHYDDIADNSNLYHYSSQMRMQLISAAKSGDKEQVKQLFSNIYDQNFTRAHLRKIIKKCLVSEVLSTYLDVSREIASNNDVMSLVEEINDESDSRRAMGILEETFYQICDEIARQKGAKEEEYYNKLKSFIEDKYSDSQFDLLSCAESFGLSESYFSTFFKDVFGTTFSSYLEKIRLEKAKTLIIENKMDLEKISATVGYSSSATFRRAFKRVFGVSPSTWKQLAQQI